MKEGHLSKIKYLLIWKILCDETDEQHPMSTKDLLEILKDRYGIDCDRRTLYRNIEEINDCGCGFEIGTRRNRSNMYYAKNENSPNISNAQIRILLDAVRAMSSISERQTTELVNKISLLAGNQADKLREGSTKFFVAKSPEGEKIFDSVDVIAQAIERKKKITFRYFSWRPPQKEGGPRRKRDRGKRTLNPVATVFSEEKYYLIGYDDKHGAFRNYRIDHMENVKMMTDDITDQIDTPHGKRQDVREYQRTQLRMYAGTPMQVIFLIDETLWEEADIKFRDNIDSVTSTRGKVRVVATVQKSPTFIGWCCSFGTDLQVISPPELVSELKNYTKSLAKQYESKN